jgi:hypothetical protein
MKICRFIFLLIGLLFFCFIIKAQGLNDRQKKLVIRNIISYHFRYAINYDLGLSANNVLKGEKYFFNEFWPDEKNRLEIDVESPVLTYPIPHYQLYRIINKFKFYSDSLIHFRNMHSFHFDENYLIAVDSNTGTIKFLSGNFFLSPIASDFNLIKNSPASFLEYLKIRFFNIKPINIKFIKKKGGAMLFSAHSSIVDQEVILLIDEKDFENTSLRYLKKSFLY